VEYNIEASYSRTNCFQRQQPNYLPAGVELTDVCLAERRVCDRSPLLPNKDFKIAGPEEVLAV
jgi:hypothetical protein